jgi:hypothetical protein
MKVTQARTTAWNELVFLFDVDNTLLDNDRVIDDLRKHLHREVGPQRALRYWSIFDQLRSKLGYADYLGALQRYRAEYPRDLRLLTVSRFLIDYPFANRLFPNSLDVIDHCQETGNSRSSCPMATWCFSPTRWSARDCSRPSMATCPHLCPQGERTRRREETLPRRHYVLVDDKLRILPPSRNLARRRVTTIFVRQGHYAVDPKVLAAYPPADVQIDHIGDLLQADIP